MPLGTPQGPTQSVWKVTASSVATVGGDYPVTFEVAATTDNPDAPEVGGIVQQFVDLIAKSGTFKVLVATRSYGYVERMTPTE